MLVVNCFSMSDSASSEFVVELVLELVGLGTDIVTLSKGGKMVLKYVCACFVWNRKAVEPK
jgi:hypothetical protein